MKLSLILILSIFLIGIVFYLVKPVREIEYQGYKFVFRENVKEAKKVPIFPNSSFIKQKLLETNHLVLLYSAKQDLSLVTVEAFELAYKLTVLLNKIFGKNVKIEAKSVEEANYTSNILFIYLLTPNLANQTRIFYLNQTIYVEGKTKKELDLAVIKLILLLME